MRSVEVEAPFPWHCDPRITLRGLTENVEPLSIEADRLHRPTLRPLAGPLGIPPSQRPRYIPANRLVQFVTIRRQAICAVRLQMR